MGLFAFNRSRRVNKENKPVVKNESESSEQSVTDQKEVVDSQIEVVEQEENKQQSKKTKK